MGKTIRLDYGRELGWVEIDVKPSSEIRDAIAHEAKQLDILFYKDIM